jgi:hypothetical protein
VCGEKSGMMEWWNVGRMRWGTLWNVGRMGGGGMKLEIGNWKKE